MYCCEIERLDLFSPDQKVRYQRLQARLAEYYEHGAGVRGGYADYRWEGVLLGMLNDLCNEVEEPDLF